MVWEFPAVSQSRVEFWKEPQFTKSGMWWFTLAFGFFGLHHLYLRSPQTALIFCIANFLTLGFPWFYDLIQLSSAGETLESLNKHGLNTHVYLLGVAQGMWKKDEALIPSFAVREAETKGSAPAVPFVPKPISEFGGNPAPAPATATAPAPAPTPSEPWTPRPISEFGGNPAPATAAAPAPSEPWTPRPISEFGGNPAFAAAPAPAHAPAPASEPWTPRPISEFGGNPKAPAPAPAPPAPAEFGAAPLTRAEKYAKLMSIKSAAAKREEKARAPYGLAWTATTGRWTGKQRGGGLDGPPNPTWFLLYALLIPMAPLAQLIAGDTNNAVSRFLDLTIIPLGFLFYYCAFMYDYFILLFYPADLFVAGSKRFFPFTYLGMDIEGHSERLTGISEIKPCPADGFIMTMFRIALPILSVVSPGLAESIKAALDTANKTKEIVIDQGLEKINKATRIAKQASDLATTVGSLGPMPQLQVPHLQVPQMSAQTAQRAALGLPVMLGGALPKEPFSPLDYAALGSLGAVIAGGFILSMNRTQNDSPPKPGRV